MERDYITVAGNKGNQILCLPLYLFIWPFPTRGPSIWPFLIPAMLLRPLSSKRLTHSSLFRFIPLSHPPFLSFSPPPANQIPSHFCKEKEFLLHFYSALALICLLIREPSPVGPLFRAAQRKQLGFARSSLSPSYPSLCWGRRGSLIGSPVLFLKNSITCKGQKERPCPASVSRSKLLFIKPTDFTGDKMNAPRGGLGQSLVRSNTASTRETANLNPGVRMANLCHFLRQHYELNPNHVVTST